MKRRTTLISSIAVLALAGAGTAAAVTAADDDAPARTDSSATAQAPPSVARPKSTVTPTPSAPATTGAAPRAEDVMAAALLRVPGVVTEAELDSGHGRTVWEVDIEGDDGERHHVDVDPATGDVVRTHTRRHGHDDHGRDDGHEHERDRTRPAGSRTSAQDAARIGAAKGTVTSVEPDDNAWEVETRSADGTEREWRISLTAPNPAPRPADDD